jgi:hypothetical protein
MDEQREHDESESQEDVEGHLLKESLVTGAAAAAMFAGSAQARIPVEPGTGAETIPAKAQIDKQKAKPKAPKPAAPHRNRADADGHEF